MTVTGNHPLEPIIRIDDPAVCAGGSGRLLEALRKQEQVLKDTETLQQTWLASILAGVIVVDPETHIIESVNKAAADMFGASPEAIVGHRCHTFFCSAAEGACPILDLGKTVDNMEQELLCADDVEGNRPGFTDLVGRAKYDAWGEIKGETREMAMSQYIALIESLKRS